MPPTVLEPAFSEVAEWKVMDVNVRLGRCATAPPLALESDALLAEMDRFGIESAVVSHWMAQEYDAEQGNEALARARHARFVPAWVALPERASLLALEGRKPRAVRLYCGTVHHNFSSALWSCGELCEHLQQHSVLTLISREDIEWNSVAELLQNFPQLPLVVLDIGYRADRYLFPLLHHFSNLYFDSSTYLAHRQLESYVDRFGPERVLFGSRLPLYTPAAALGVLAGARISGEAKLAIAGGNLRRLLRIPEGTRAARRRA